MSRVRRDRVTSHGTQTGGGRDLVNRTAPRTSQGDVPIHQAVLEGMSAGVIVIDVTGRIQYLNPAGERMFGLDLLEVSGHPLREFVSPPNEMDRISELRALIVANGSWNGELRLRRNGGDEFTVHVNASLLRDSGGEPSAIVVVAEELDADNRTEAALLEALEQFRALAECMPSLVRFAWDDGRPAWYNGRFLEFSGLSYRELERRGWRELIHPEDRDNAGPAGVRQPWEAEVRMRRHDGEYRWMMVRTARVFDARGGVIGFVGIAADIHERRMAEAAAAAAHAHLDAIWQSSPVGLAIMDSDYRWVRVNEHMVTMSGVPAEQWIGKRPYEVLERVRDHVNEFREELERTGEAILRRERSFEVDGETFYRLDSWIPMRSGSGELTGIAVVCEDITPEKRTQTAAERAVRELDAIFEAVPVGLGMYDQDMNWKRFNAEMERMSRTPASQVVGKKAGTAIPRTRARFEDVMRRFRSGEPLVRDEREVEIEGDLEWRLDSAAPIRDEQGNLLGIVVACEDITPQKLAQKTAEDALRELDAVYQGAPVGLAVMDRDFRFLRVNERLAEMTGLPLEAHIGRLAGEVVPGVQGQARDEVEAVRRGEPVMGVELTTVGPDGEERHYLEHWVPLRNSDGEVVGVSVAVEDVTERKRAEAEQAADRERLQRVLDTLLEAVVITDARGEITFADQQWIERTGLDPATCTREEAEQLVHPEDRGRIDERWRIARSSNRPFTATYRVRQKDGSYRWQISRAIPLLDPAGRATEWIGTLADIDEEKQNQEALATALAELDITYRMAPVGLGVLDLDLRYIRLNEQLASVAGLPVEDLIGKSVPEMVPDIAGAARAVRDRIVETGEAVLGIETEGFAPGPGEYRYRLENWIPIKDDDGKVIAISVSVEDVTSLKHAERELQTKHAELDAVFQTTTVGLALLDRDLHFVRVNDRLAEINRTPVEAHIGRTVGEIIPDLQEYCEAMARRVLAGERVVGDLQESTGDGVRTWAQISWVPVRDEDGRIAGIGVAVEDVTPLKRAELRLQAALSELGTTYRFAPVGLAVFDLEGRFVRVNDRLLAMHGLPTWEHIGRSSADVLGAGDWAGAIVERAAATGEPVLGAEVSATLPRDGAELRHFRVSCAPMRNHRDEIFAIATAVEDITDMKENEMLLLESEHRLRTILDAVPAAVGVTDPTGQLIYLNRHWLNYSGMDLIGARTEDLSRTFYPNEIEDVFGRWRRALDSGEPFEVVQRLKRKDGDYRWHLGRIVPMRGADGSVTGWVSTNIDIHDRKTMEEQLEAALGEIEATYQGAPIGLAVVDRELRYVRVNEVLAAANGMPAWRHAGRRLADLARCPAENVEALAREVLRTGEPRLNVELEAAARRGRSQTWRFSMVPLRDAARQIIGVSIAAEDVTARKRADDEVRAAKDHLRQILDSIPAPVVVLDDSGLLRFGNARFWEYTGLEHDPELAHPMEPLSERIFHADEREGVMDGLRGALDKFEGFATVCRLRRYDGEYRWHMGAAMALPLGDGQREWVATFMDFQDRKTAEEALQGANRVKDEFLGLVSHELRTPLTTVLGLADMLRRRMDQMDRETRMEALEQLEEDAKRLNELIENMLLLSRAERAEFEPEPVLLQRLAPMVLAVAAERHREARWEMDVPEDLPPVAGKAGWLEQVLHNLVENAVKYSTAPATVRLEAQPAGREVVLRVLDRGRGLRGDEADLMFEPFYRSRSSSGQPGVGLGLAVCRRLIELMDGEISAKPRAGGGTVITLKLCATSTRGD